MKLIIGNKNYSSWSLRGWLAAKQSGAATPAGLAEEGSALLMEMLRGRLTDMMYHFMSTH